MTQNSPGQGDPRSKRADSWRKDPRSVRFGFVVAALSPILFGAIAVSFGQDCNWDLRNYHFYNVFAWFSGRYAFDFAPGYLCSYYNPTLFVPRVLAMQYLSPVMLAAVTGAVQGCVVWPVYWFGVRLLPIEQPRMRSAVAAALAYVGALGAIGLSQLGTSFIDTTAATIALVGLGFCLLVDWHRAADGRSRLRSCAIGAFILGSLTALRLQSILYVVGALAALTLTQYAARRQRLLALTTFSVGTASGFCLGMLPWGLTMWHHFRNPIFPLLNGVFRSPYASVVNSYAPTLMPPSKIVEWLFLPFVVLTEPSRGHEVPFFDLRLPMLYAVVVLACVGWRFRWPWYGSELLTRTLIAFGGAYLVFLVRFTNYRFGVGFEIMAPLLAVLILAAMFRPTKVLGGVVAFLFAIVLVTTRRADWGHTEFGASHLGVPELAVPDDALLISTGHRPTSYVVASVPSSVAMIRLNADGDSLHSPDIHTPVSEPNPIEPRLRERLRAHRGPLYLLTAEPATADAALHRYGLSVAGSCSTPKPYVALEGPLSVCPLRRE